LWAELQKLNHHLQKISNDFYVMDGNYLHIVKKVRITSLQCYATRYSALLDLFEDIKQFRTWIFSKIKVLKASHRTFYLVLILDEGWINSLNFNKKWLITDELENNFGVTVSRRNWSMWFFFFIVHYIQLCRDLLYFGLDLL